MFDIILAATGTFGIITTLYYVFLDFVKYRNVLLYGSIGIIMCAIYFLSHFKYADTIYISFVASSVVAGGMTLINEVLDPKRRPNITTLFRRMDYIDSIDVAIFYGFLKKDSIKCVIINGDEVSPEDVDVLLKSRRCVNTSIGYLKMVCGDFINGNISDVEFLTYVGQNLWDLIVECKVPPYTAKTLLRSERIDRITVTKVETILNDLEETQSTGSGIKIYW